MSGSRPPEGVRRRSLLAVVGTAAVATIAGCASSARSSRAAATPTPIALDGGKQDDQGGMIIGEHYGPNGQLFYRDHAPDGHDNPAWFHTLAHGFFPYYFEHDRLGWTVSAAYVTDYSAVEYDLLETGDRTFISTHTAASTFADAFEMTYVAGSRVLGGMGSELIPFSEPTHAESFTDAHGGTLTTFDEVTEAGNLDFSHDH